MGFLRSNTRKIYTCCFVWLILYLLAFCFYYTTTHNLAMAISESLLSALFIFVFTMLTFLIGLNSFEIKNRLFFRTPENSIIDVFDNNAYEIIQAHERSFFLFTDPQLKGFIAGYPVTVYVDTAKYGSFNIKFSVHKSKGIYANTIRYETLSIPWNWRRHLESNIKTDVDEFLKELKEKGNEIPLTKE